MKSTVFITAFLLMLLFTSTKTYDYKMEEIVRREKEINKCRHEFQGQYYEGLSLERRLDSLEIELRRREREINFLTKTGEL